MWRNQDPPHIAGDNVQQCSHFEKIVWQFLKVLNRITTWPRNSALPKRNHNIYPHKNFNANVDNGIIHDNQKVKTAQMFNDWWIAKQNVVYSYNEILFDNKKEWHTDSMWVRGLCLVKEANHKICKIPFI
jgi:hypothetical protein